MTRLVRAAARCRLAAALWIGLALACGREDAGSVASAPLVAVAAVEGHDLVDRIAASGELQAVDHAEIAAEVEGRVTELLVDEGEPAAADQPLLHIDPERRELQLADARARVAEARSAEREARREHDRLKQLHARGAVSSAQLDQAETGLQAARSRLDAAAAQLELAERALRDATVRAPFSGLVARRFVSRGEYVRPGESLLDLVSLDPIEVEFHLPEADSSRVQADMPVSVEVAPYPDQTFAGRVTMIAPTIDPATRTLRVQAQLANTEALLRPGLFARVDLGIATRTGVPLVPEEAVLQRADGAVVFVLGPGSRVERRVIETGRHRGGSVEVASGLVPGDWVAVRGHTDLLDGMVVEARGVDGAVPPTPLARGEVAAEGERP